MGPQVRVRDMRPSEGDPILSSRRSDRCLGQVAEVVERVAYPCRWFVYDRRGDGFPIEPLGNGSWKSVTENNYEG
ncbi:MAG: hypothetical protein KY468_01005 [Armatimonadetes bacterium]|nr:hypothetical protein [Armatimonadota bacterium]